MKSTVILPCVRAACNRPTNRAAMATLPLAFVMLGRSVVAIVWFVASTTAMIAACRALHCELISRRSSCRRWPHRMPYVHSNTVGSRLERYSSRCSHAIESMQMNWRNAVASIVSNYFDTLNWWTIDSEVAAIAAAAVMSDGPCGTVISCWDLCCCKWVNQIDLFHRPLAVGSHKWANYPSNSCSLAI